MVEQKSENPGRSPIFESLGPNTSIKRFRDQEDELVYIHIGKCGGQSLWDAIQRSPVVNQQFSSVIRVHVAEPPVLARSKYLIVVRNPISRAISAFNWRYKLVVEDEVKKDRASQEYQVLAKYGTLNALAEALYDDGSLNDQVVEDLRSIGHLRMDISFYLSKILPSVRSDQIFSVLTTEFLDSEVARELNIEDVKREHQNRPSVDLEKKHLSDCARSNLRQFLSEDYRAVEELLDLKGISGQRRDVLLR